MAPHALSNMTWTDVASGSASILAVPLGSCEQHGPHLPLDTDTRIAVGLSNELARRNSAVVVAPPITITASGEHAGFPGTLSIGTGVLTSVLVELVRSAGWAARTVLVNGHGGNRAAVDLAVGQSIGEGRRVLAWWPHVPGGDAHAGHVETSLMLALEPTAVRLDRVEPGSCEPLGELMPALRSHGLRAASPNGILGDPRTATADAGNALLGALVDDLVGTITRWA